MLEVLRLEKLHNKNLKYTLKKKQFKFRIVSFSFVTIDVKDLKKISKNDKIIEYY